MKKVTKKALGILALVVLSVPAQAGWLSNLGQRIVNGAANTVQTNISGKVNKAVNDVMDGKVGNQPSEKKTNQKSKETSTAQIQDSKVSAKTAEEAVEGKITSTTKRGRAIPYTNKYEDIDLGITKFRGEPIFGQSLKIGQTKSSIDQFLDPGYYLISISASSYSDHISAIYEHEEKGIQFGFGIVTRKRIYDTGNYKIVGGQNGLLYIVEVLEGTQGHLEVNLVNSQRLMGSGNLSIYKIPGPTLK